MGLTPTIGLSRRSGQVRFTTGRSTACRTAAETAVGSRDVDGLSRPMTSLNPVMTVGRQITEPLRHHLGRNRRQAKAEAVDLLRSVGIAEPLVATVSTHTSCPAGCGNGR